MPFILQYKWLMLIININIINNFYTIYKLFNDKCFNHSVTISFKRSTLYFSHTISVNDEAAMNQNTLNNSVAVAFVWKLTLCSPCRLCVCTETCWRSLYNILMLVACIFIFCLLQPTNAHKQQQQGIVYADT
jgi:hypothetical protein